MRSQPVAMQHREGTAFRQAPQVAHLTFSGNAPTDLLVDSVPDRSVFLFLKTTAMASEADVLNERSESSLQVRSAQSKN
jgi:hypothetical protein